MSTQESQSDAVGFRLSPQQERLLGDGPGSEQPIAQVVVRLAGARSEAQLRTALSSVVARHEILRTTFPATAGLRGRRQIIHASLAPEWVADASSPAGDPADPAWIVDVMAVEARPFDLDRGPLMRARLLGTNTSAPHLVLSAHAACADPASLLVALTELLGPSTAELEEPVQYADYAEWRHELITQGETQAPEETAFWRGESASPASAAALLFAGAAGSGAAQGLTVDFDAAELEAIAAAAAAAGVTLGLFLEAAWHALVVRLTAAEDAVVAGLCDGRAQPDLERAIGPYMQAVPIRSHVDAETSFAEIIDQVRRGRVAAAAAQDLATGDQLAAVSRTAATAFIELDLQVLPGDGTVVAVNPSAGADLLLAVAGGSGKPTVTLWRNPGRHDHAQAEELVRRLRTLANAAAVDSSGPVIGLSMVTPDERKHLLAGAAGPLPEPDAAVPVHKLFERQAAVDPDRPAVAASGDEYSYSEVNAAANRIAHRLREAGVAPGATVALCLERTPALLIALLGILKAGTAYLPLNDEHPRDRLAHELAESGAAALVTEAGLLQRLPAFSGSVICVDREAKYIAALPAGNPDLAVVPEDTAYVMYTSGSTGLPKGVVVTHGNLANYATQMAHRLCDGERGLRFGVVSAISTDLGNTCIFPPLVSGGCVQLFSPGAAMDPAALAAELGTSALDVLKITPSHLRALLAGADTMAFLPRRRLVLGGEALSWDLVGQIREMAPHGAILNHYGPTETTVGCCAYDVGPVRADAATVPIGRPLAGLRAYVLDPGGQPLPAGVPGELCVAGAGVARGYVGAPEDAASPFGADPFAAGPERMYRTGDRARILRDGTIEFLGRLDDQVKIRGFRVELGEIESVLRRHPAIRDAAALAERDERENTRLVAYLASSAPPAVAELQDFLAASLPEYMIPAAFATLESLPLTPSGKVDRQALSGVALLQTRREATYVAPRDEYEREIAAIWSELLGVEQVGVLDDFFALGGHSLLATQTIMRIRRRHGSISLRALLAAPTVADLAAVVRASHVDPS